MKEANQFYSTLIKELMAAGVRPEEIALRTGSTVNAVYRWLRGSHAPSKQYKYRERLTALYERKIGVRKEESCVVS